VDARERLWRMLEPGAGDGWLSRVVAWSIQALICLNVTSVILESVGGIRTHYGPYLQVFDGMSVILFTVEYALRVYSCTATEQYSRPLAGRLRFALTPLAMLDLLCILPFYLPFIGLDLRFLRLFRLLRFARIGRFARYSRALRLVGRAFYDKREELVVSLLVLLTLLVVSSCAVYEAERFAQPEAFPDIPAALWWTTMTASGLGCRDIEAITPAGKVVTTVIALLGVGLFALPAGIAASGLIDQVGTRSPESRRCPHCHREL
jgi:voltage-gated potassium channel